MIGFSLVVIGFFTWFSNYIPQIESHPPLKISLEAMLSGDEMIEAGERIFTTKGTCNICHAIGRRGNRGPDLANIAQRAQERISGMSAKGYLLESLLKPTAYLVQGYGPLMPPMAGILTPGEILVTVAYLQSLGGEVDINPDDVRAALKRFAPGGVPSTVSTAVSAPTPAGKGDPAQGRKVFTETCAACHGPDPNQDGPVGPRIKGAPPELIEARLLRQGYPPGYKPLRTTKLMPPMPYLKDRVRDIAAFLAQ